MEGLKANCLALAQEALKPPQTFDPKSRILTRKLEDLLQSVEGFPPDELTAHVANFVFFPLRSLLQQDSLGDRQTELLFECLTVLCKTAWRQGEMLQLERAQQLLAVTTYLSSPEPVVDPGMDSGNGGTKVSPTFLAKPTTFHTAAFKLLNAIFESANGSSIHEPLSKSPVIVQVISLLLDAIQHDDQDIQAQLASISCLETIVVSTITNPDHRALVLPRAASKLTRLLSPTNKRHFSVKVTALNCFDAILVNTVGDATFSETPSKVRTAEWTKTTMENLNQSFLVIEKLQKSLLEVTAAKIPVLDAIYNFARNVFTRAENIVSKDEQASETLVNILLLTKSQTLDLKLAEDAAEFLRVNDAVLHNKIQTRTTKQLQELPNILNNASESSSLFQLQTLENSLQLTASSSNIESIVDAVELSLPLKIKRQTLSVPTSIRHIKTFTPTHHNSSFLDLTKIGLDIDLSTAVQSSLSQLLATVGSKISSAEATSLVGTVANRLRALDMRGAKSLDATGLLWIASNIIRGLPQDSDIYDLITYCFENIDNALNIDDVDVSSSSISSMPHTALCCYVVGEAALLQGSSFNEYLMELVYPLFSLIGHAESQAIRDQAALAISKVSYACGFNSPQELAVANKDYLVDGWSLQLNTLNMTPSTFESLASLIFISGESIIPYLDDVFASLFVLMDRYYGYSRLVKGVLTIFAALTFVVSKDVAPKLTTPTRTVEIETFDDLLAELTRKPEVDPAILDKKIDLENFGKPKPEENLHDENSLKADEEEESDNEMINDEPDQAVEKWDYALPKSTYMTLQKVAGYCDRLMTHEFAEIRMATLVLITELMPFLAINKELFLPLIHKTWPEATTRVFDKEAFVVEQSFACLSAMAGYAQDFVASRIDTLFPKLLAKYSNILARKWPQFSVEQRIATAFSEFFKTTVEYISDLSLRTLESGIVAFRPALLRGEFTKLRTALSTAKPSISDLLWLVLLETPHDPSHEITECTGDLHIIAPVYST